MIKILVGILLFLMGASFVAENILAHKYSSVAIKVSSDDAAEEKSESAKDKKGEYEEKFFTHQVFSSSSAVRTAKLQSFASFSFLSSGFTDKPFTPPDLM